MAENLWVLRDQKKMSVAALANRAGLPINLIIEYESGSRSIDPRHLSRLARALYVEEGEIKLQSDPRPETVREARPAPREQAPAPRPPKPREKPVRGKGPAKPPPPARPTQIEHIETLLEKVKRTREDLENELGKPIRDLDRSQASDLIRSLQAEISKAGSANRHRAYLPEAVDQFEAKYLTDAQAAGAHLSFGLFDGSTLAGRLIGFGPYSVTIQQEDGSEVTINKLAVVTYRKEPDQ